MVNKIDIDVLSVLPRGRENALIIPKVLAW